MSRSIKFGFQGYLSAGICVPLLNGNNRATENKENFCEYITGFYWLATGSELTLRRLMSYIYGAPILDVSRSHTTTQHSR